MLIFTLMYAGLASAWNILGGYTGYISLGQAAFFGIGAYAIGITFTHIGIGAGYRPFYVLPLVGVGVAMVSVPVGWVALRTRAATFAIVTITLPLRRAAARIQPARHHRRLAGTDGPVPAVSAREVRVALLLRDARHALHRDPRVLVRARQPARPRPVLDPRRRGPGARDRRAGHEREGARLRAQRRAHRHDRRSLGLLPRVHLPAVRGRPARDDRDGADGLPRREGHALGAR